MLSDLERANPYELGVQTAVEGALSQLWTAMPGAIVSFDPVRQTASVQPSIQAEVTASNGKVSLQTLPLLLDCPVHFPRGGGCVLTFPVSPGDECLVVFASRCIDAWWQNGGVQPQAELRMHDLSDGFVIVGFSSLPHVVADLSTTATELRSLDGATKIALDPDAQTLDLIAPGGVSITSPTLTHNGVNVGSTHHHGGVTSGGSFTGVPS